MKDFLWNLLGFTAGCVIGGLLLVLVILASCGHPDDPELEDPWGPPDSEILVFEQIWIWPGE